MKKDKFHEKEKIADTLLKEAEELEEKRDLEKAALKYQDAGNKFYSANLDLSFTDEALATGRKITPERKKYLLKFIECYKKSAELFEKVGKLHMAFGFWGAIGQQYFEIFKSLSQREIERERCRGEPPRGKYLFCDADTYLGKIARAYEKAADILHEIGVKHEEKNQLRKASLYYGTTGDAYLSIYIAYKEAGPIHLFGGEREEAEHLYYAAECYFKAGSLIRTHGIATVIGRGRSEWADSLGEIHNLFIDSQGYSTMDDLKRAKFIYEKAKGLFVKRQDKEYIDRCEKRLKEIKRLLFHTNEQTDITMAVNTKSEEGNITSRPSVVEKILELRDKINARFKNGDFLKKDERVVGMLYKQVAKISYMTHVQALANWIDKMDIDVLSAKLPFKKIAGGKPIQQLEQCFKENDIKATDLIQILRDIKQLRKDFPTHTGKEITQNIEKVWQRWGVTPETSVEGKWGIILQKYLSSLDKLYKIFKQKFN